jgi:hypothetical protein
MTALTIKTMKMGLLTASWLRKLGAEQNLFGGVNISASVSETLQGPVNKSLTAGFKHSW